MSEDSKLKAILDNIFTDLKSVDMVVLKIFLKDYDPYYLPIYKSCDKDDIRDVLTRDLCGLAVKGYTINKISKSDIPDVEYDEPKTIC